MAELEVTVVSHNLFPKTCCQGCGKKLNTIIVLSVRGYFNYVCPHCAKELAQELIRVAELLE